MHLYLLTDRGIGINFVNFKENLKNDKAMKKLMILEMFIISGLFVSAQNIADSITVKNHKPQIKIEVNKIYDKNGNVIRYDSTYVWSYSNGNSKAFSVNPDSLLKRFKPYFDEHFSGVVADSFNRNIFNDSTMMFDFFNNDNFFDQWQNELFDFKNQIEKMDSLKRQFFKKYMKENKKIKPSRKAY